MTPSKKRAAAELFADLYPGLAGWCRRLVDDDGTAHEIASEAFARLWAHWSSVSEPRGFVYVTAANLVRDHWRRLDRERKAVRRAGTEAVLDGQRRAQAGAETAVPVRMLVQSLPERLRTAVLLYYYADLPVREIALLTKRKEGTIRADLHAAREYLRAGLGERLDHTR